jgi:hypothetical protein
LICVRASGWVAPELSWIGHGLAMAGALANGLSLAAGRDGRGTAVTMAFGAVPPPDAPPGLEVLGAVALERDVWSWREWRANLPV